MNKLVAKQERPLFENYPSWLLENHQVDLSNSDLKKRYEMCSLAILSELDRHAFVTGAEKQLQEIAKEYIGITGTALLLGEPGIQLVRKPYESVVNKSYRENIAWNKRWPNPPDGGWAFPSEWPTRFDDIIRTTIVCRYVDGCSFISARLKDFATAHGLETFQRSLQNDEGYYAYHLYVRVPIDWLGEKGASATLEIQVTTQVQDLLRSLSHSVYEDRRIKLKLDRNGWKWDFESSEFMSGYVGHTLHFLEGILVRMRDGLESHTVEPREGDANADQ